MGLRSASSAIILFSCLMYLHLFEIAIYLWLGSIGDTKEFQMLFIVKLREIIYFRQLTVDGDFFYFPSVRGTVSFATVIRSYHATSSLSNGE